MVPLLNRLQLALKHRQNKSQRPRIIVFTCSPIEEDEKSLVKLAKRMRKFGVSVDVIAFGELGDDIRKKLEAFNENIKGGEGSHLEFIPPSSNLLSDSIITTPILAGEGMGGGASGASGAAGESGAGGNNDFEFGVDPSMDPELALALRMSYEEEKARQERERKAKEAAEGKSELENIPEEGEKQSLLDKDGEPSGSKDKDGDKKGDDDKMDTA